MSNQHVPARDRFWSHVERAGKRDCWHWTGATVNGYGILNINGRRDYAHRFSLVLHRRRIPIGLVVDHLCMNRRCVNPHHLDVVTRGENSRRGVAANTNRRKAERKATP